MVLAMQTAATSRHFDAATLVSLLNASFAAWGVTAKACSSSATTLSVQVFCADGRALNVARIADGARGLPVWCHGPLDMPLQAAPRNASVAAMLGELRAELEPGYVPHALLMGAACPDVL